MTQLSKLKGHTHGEGTERRGEAEGANVIQTPEAEAGGLIQEAAWLKCGRQAGLRTTSLALLTKELGLATFF